MGVHINSGAGSDRPLFLRGTIDELSIFDTALTPDEIKKLATP